MRIQTTPISKPQQTLTLVRVEGVGEVGGFFPALPENH